MQTQTIPTFTQGDRLRKAREVAGYRSYKDFAEVVGMHPDSLSRIEERGTKRQIVLKAWADATGVPITWLEGNPSDYKTTVSRRPVLSRPPTRKSHNRG